MTQKNYENYLGIFRMTEIQVASQPRANRDIPLIEKEYLENIFEHGKLFFAIFDENRTQKVYENYLEIFGMTELQVASQPRANRVIF